MAHKHEKLKSFDYLFFRSSPHHVEWIAMLYTNQPVFNLYENPWIMSPNELNGGRIFDDKYQPQWQISLGPDEWWINSAGGHEGERRKIKCVKYKIEHYKHLPFPFPPVGSWEWDIDGVQTKNPLKYDEKFARDVTALRAPWSRKQHKQSYPRTREWVEVAFLSMQRFCRERVNGGMLPLLLWDIVLEHLCQLDMLSPILDGLEEAEGIAEVAAIPVATAIRERRSPLTPVGH